jgi:hypothetical protein
MSRSVFAAVVVMMFAGVASAGVLFPPVKSVDRRAPDYYNLTPHQVAVIEALRHRHWPVPEINYEPNRHVDSWFSRDALRSASPARGSELYYDKRDQSERMERMEDMNLHESERDKDEKDATAQPTTRPVQQQKKGTIIIKPWKPRNAEQA